MSADDLMVPCWNYHRHGEGAKSVEELVAENLPAVCPECNDTGIMYSSVRDVLVSRIKELETALALVARNVDAMCCMGQENVDEIDRLVGEVTP